MDALLRTLGYQTVNIALKSGLVFTGKYAIQQCSRLLKTINDKSIYAELRSLERLLESKIKVRGSASKSIRSSFADVHIQ